VADPLDVITSHFSDSSVSPVQVSPSDRQFQRTAQSNLSVSQDTVHTASPAQELTPPSTTRPSPVPSVGRIGILSGWSPELRASLEQEQAEWNTADELARRPQYDPTAPVCFEYDQGDCASLQTLKAAAYTGAPAVTASAHCNPTQLASLAVSEVVVQPSPAELWLRHHQGRWQRRVTLNQLNHHSQYNNMTGWADLEQLEASAGGPPKLLPVHLEHLNRS
jgi:hypothetical protein